jgi:hypothetical protein
MPKHELTILATIRIIVQAINRPPDTLAQSFGSEGNSDVVNFVRYNARFSSKSK